MDPIAESDQPPASSVDTSASPPSDDRALPMKPVLSVPEVARLLGISRAFTYDLVAQGRLPHVRLGRRIVVPRRVIEALVAVDGDTVTL
jgi:excisionase family DNA binding protein